MKKHPIPIQYYCCKDLYSTVKGTKDASVDPDIMSIVRLLEGHYNNVDDVNERLAYKKDKWLDETFRYVMNFSESENQKTYPSLLLIAMVNFTLRYSRQAAKALTSVHVLSLKVENKILNSGAKNLYKGYYYIVDRNMEFLEYIDNTSLSNEIKVTDKKIEEPNPLEGAEDSDDGASTITTITVGEPDEIKETEPVIMTVDVAKEPDKTYMGIPIKNEPEVVKECNLSDARKAFYTMCLDLISNADGVISVINETGIVTAGEVKDLECLLSDLSKDVEVSPSLDLECSLELNIVMGEYSNSIADSYKSFKKVVGEFKGFLGVFLTICQVLINHDTFMVEAHKSVLTKHKQTIDSIASELKKGLSNGVMELEKAFITELLKEKK